MIITLSGKAGSGKSTIAKLLAKKLNYKHYSMGDLQREIAKEKGITIVELGELEKTDPEIDHMIDDKQKNLGKNQDNFVIDSWLSACFIPHAFKIFLDGEINVRAKRITKKREAENYTQIEEAIKAIKQREKTSQDRFLEFYNFDYLDMNNYDLVVDTSKLSIEEVLKLILSKIP